MEECKNDILLTHEKLDVQKAFDTITSPYCGGSSFFLGTTRDVFEGKHVTSLDYECYETMAQKEILKICKEIREEYPEIRHIAVHHRLGNVPVKEASILVATNSPHRKDCIQATAEVVDRVKAKVPIWKKEVYADGTTNWMSNKECEWATSTKS